VASARGGIVQMIARFLDRTSVPATGRTRNEVHRLIVFPA
jgi:hypothetical protein